MPRFGDNPKRQQSKVARALGISPSAVNRLVNEGKGGSLELIENIERLLNEPHGTILGYTSIRPVAPRFRDIPEFAEVINEAERRVKLGKIQLSRMDLEFAGDLRLSPPPKRFTPDLLIQLALSLADDGSDGSSSAKRRTRKK